MPEISRFFGVIIRMYAEPRGRHSLAHFHAYYQGQVAVVGIRPVKLLAGHLPKQQRRQVETWTRMHANELLADWLLLQAGRLPVKIDPLT
jgi:hypothetical protein